MEFPYNIIKGGTASLIALTVCSCKNKPEEKKTWRIKLPDGPGMYRVYVYAGKHIKYPDFM